VKKLAAILILGVMLFNGFGYRIVANYFDQKAAENFIAIIEDEQYNESDLVTIKTPVNLPYYANNAKFERVDGEMVIDGIVYQYVQRRVYNDSIEIKNFLYLFSYFSLTTFSSLLQCLTKISETQGGNSQFTSF
jgi:hypothetical protein